MSETAVAELWADYIATRHEELRNRLVVQYSPLVKFVAGRIRSGLPSTVHQADLISDGVFGLIDAIERFEPDRGLQFQTFAVPRIRGAIIDGLRSMDWVPRSVRSKLRDVTAAQAALEMKLGRVADDHEVAVEVGLSLAELRGLYSKVSLTSVASLEEVGGGLVDEHEGSVLEAAEDEDTRRLLRSAIGGLRERDQVILALYYFEQLTLAEIGLVLGVTESRISQLHTRAMLALRGHLVALEVAL